MSVYIGRHFLVSFVGLFMMFLMLILLFDIIELLRRSATKPDVTLSVVVEMALMKLPHMGQKTFPFAALFGGMLAFWRLTRHQELVVARAAGVSAWQFLLPVLVLSAALGVLKIMALNPLASATLARFEQLETIHMKGQRSFLDISSSGLWLRQATENEQAVVHSKSVLQQGVDVELHDVIVFLYGDRDKFKGRIDAAYARLEDGFWHMRDAWVHDPDKKPKFEKEFWLETDLTLATIQDNFAPPETMSFWNLPGFIENLENSGFTAVRHRLHLHTLLSMPLLMCAMILIAATFTLRHSRRGGTVFVISGGVMTGFILYFFSDLMFALGLSNSIPVVLAAWTPSGVSTLLGLTMVLHLEDG